MHDHALQFSWSAFRSSRRWARSVRYAASHRLTRRPLSPSSSLLQNFVLRILHLHAVRGELEVAKQDDSLMRMEDIVQERLIEEHGAQRAGVIADEHFEDLEPRPARRAGCRTR